MFEQEDAEERPEWYAREVVLSCTPANAEHAKGKPVASLTIADRAEGDIGNWTFDLPDCRRIVTNLLVVLASFDDEFAHGLLKSKFSSDKDGTYIWPEHPDRFM